MPTNAEDPGDRSLIPGLGSSPGGGHGKPLQYSCLENPMDRGAWWATVHGATKRWTWVSTYAAALLQYCHRSGFPEADNDAKIHMKVVY